MKAFLRDLAAMAVYLGAFLVMNAHSVRPIHYPGWLVLLLAVLIVPYSAWLRLTVSGREQVRRHDAGLRGAYGMYCRTMSRFSLALMAPAFAVGWLTQSVSGFTFTCCGTIIAVYLYAVVANHARKRTLA